MNHQPFNSWLFEDNELDAAQLVELKQHLQVCPECQRESHAWANVKHMLTSSETAQPRPEFAARWQASLTARRARQERRQVRITLMALAGAALLVLLGLVIYFFSTSSLANLFASVIGTSTQVAVGFVNIAEFVESLLRFLPTALSTGIWLLLAGWICLLCIAWVYSVWRVSHKGVNVHEEIN
ncbi:MAG TPA: zf-HC2 domain-containing protein [Longilinea sp.]|nr:zf-HC2 domain-containing protein [Longilinea sp.]